MKELLAHLINRGYVSFNPFTYEIRNKQYAVSTEDSFDWYVHELPPADVLHKIIEMSHKYYDKLEIGDNYKYNFFWDLLAFDSKYDLTADVCFDDYEEALKFGNEYNLFNIADLYDNDEDDYLSDTEDEI